MDKIEEADHCVTTVPVDNCLEVLLFWRHFIDPVNQACSNIKGKHSYRANNITGISMLNNTMYK